MCLCRLKSTGAEYAIKIIEGVHAKRHGGLQQVKNERDVLILLNHPSIVRFFDSFFDKSKRVHFMVIELAEGMPPLADVRATIAMARLLKRAQPRLFDYLLGLRDKRRVAEFIDLQQVRPLVLLLVQLYL